MKTKKIGHLTWKKSQVIGNDCFINQQGNYFIIASIDDSNPQVMTIGAENIVKNLNYQMLDELDAGLNLQERIEMMRNTQVSPELVRSGQTAINSKHKIYVLILTINEVETDTLTK